VGSPLKPVSELYANLFGSQLEVHQLEGFRNVACNFAYMVVQLQHLFLKQTLIQQEFHLELERVGGVENMFSQLLELYVIPDLLA
jgi:hypothetical protein